jgi:hypothetical protein
LGRLTDPQAFERYPGRSAAFVATCCAAIVGIAGYFRVGSVVLAIVTAVAATTMVFQYPKIRR